MRRFQLLVLIFFLALSVPLGYFVWRTHRGLAQEEAATLRFFGDTLFDEMEEELAALVRREESRGIDAYTAGMQPAAGLRPPGPLAEPPAEDFILGYFQNNPDGSFQSPLAATAPEHLEKRRVSLAELREANRIFNTKRIVSTDRIVPRQAAGDKELSKTAPAASLADRYLDTSRSLRSKSFLGQEEPRYEKVPPRQAMAMAEQKAPAAVAPGEPAPQPALRSRADGAAGERESDEVTGTGAQGSVGSAKKQSAEAVPPDEGDRSGNFQVEVAPMQTVFLDDQKIYCFRRIMFSGQIYRQGFVLEVRPFLEHLVRSHFIPQPMARFTRLRIAAADGGREADVLEAGAAVPNPSFSLDRVFPSPFGFLTARLTSEQLPSSAGRRVLNIMLLFLGGIFLLGAAAIYKSVGTIVEHSERRTQFVSAVTHELKTPLTNIRMYMEMLEQGMARSPEQEQAYFRIVHSEGARLSRLINNVLEMSKLERRQRPLDLQQGFLSDVIEEARAAMHAKLQLEGFSLHVEGELSSPIFYDREAMIQILINLIENSIKFGKSAERKIITVGIRREKDRALVSVVDAGPGIPEKALGKVFDEFYRADSSLTRTTRGTGIGLALVKKLVRLMGGTVRAANNQGPGCTITISLPAETAP